MTPDVFRIIESKPAATLPELWKKETISFRKINHEGGEKVSKAIIYAKMELMASLFGLDFGSEHYGYFIKYFLNHYDYLTTDDIDLFIDFVAEQKIYGKLNLQMLINLLGEYDVKRSNFAIDIATETKTEVEIDDKILDIWKDKTKDIIAPDQQLNSREKMREAQKRYLKESKNKK